MTSGAMPITVQNKIHRCTARHITLWQKNPNQTYKTEKTKKKDKKATDLQLLYEKLLESKQSCSGRICSLLKFNSLQYSLTTSDTGLRPQNLSLDNPTHFNSTSIKQK